MGSVSVRNVSKDYVLGRTIVRALHDVSLEVERSEFLSIAGPSGSGKSTLLNLVSAIDSPTTGEVLIDGVNLKDLSDNDLSDLRANKIGFIFQTFNLIPVLSAYENVEFPLLFKRQGSVSRSRVKEVLDRVGLADFMHHRPDELSGGQRQRVAVARALVTDPLIVLADEPTANLDSETGQAVIDLMLEINRSAGTTFIFSTHDPSVMSHARRVVRLVDGRIVAS
ncbi:MAG: ABC transporter ATP-binding protein [Vicinamibacteria bacterium]|nr:ABC transporter ATP-binding protein [Vicinamibacteria bacterium]MBP9946723.1 ABC transporter ATP-binding protein [Vicinamibacteria bacterium]